jgi:hypothetical protein
LSEGTGIGFRLAIEEWELTLDTTRNVIHRLAGRGQPVKQSVCSIIPIDAAAERAMQPVSLACRAGNTGNSAKQFSLADLANAAPASLHWSAL